MRDCRAIANLKVCLIGGHCSLRDLSIIKILEIKSESNASVEEIRSRLKKPNNPHADSGARKTSEVASLPSVDRFTADQSECHHN